jgi:pyruvate carboxylase subunit B
MKYQVRVGERMVEVDLTGPKPRVDGVEVDARIETVPGTPIRHLVVDGASHALLAMPGTDRGEWRITIGGRPVTVQALDERTRAIRAMVGTSAEAEKGKTVVAPMPGLIVRVNVEAGTVVAAGQGVIVVEAMKMENELKAPAAGTVAEILVSAGQAVEKGAVLVVLE